MNHYLAIALLTIVSIFGFQPAARAAYLVDTNATTDVTDHTPKKPGDVLLGNVGGTGTVWVAGPAADTNSWISLTGALGTNGVNTGLILDGTIGNADVATDAAIASSKLNLAGPTIGALTVQSNSTLTGIVTLGATQTHFSAAAMAAPTNLVAGAGVGLSVRINGTNYLLHAKPN